MDMPVKKELSVITEISEKIIELDKSDWCKYWTTYQDLYLQLNKNWNSFVWKAVRNT